MAQFKRPKQLAFQPLQQAIDSPGEFLFSDFSKIERPGLLHVAFQALDAFQVSSRSILCVCPAAQARRRLQHCGQAAAHTVVCELLDTALQVLGPFTNLHRLLDLVSTTVGGVWEAFCTKDLAGSQHCWLSRTGV